MQHDALPGPLESFTARGFALLRGVLPARECAMIAGRLRAMESAGTRRLLAQDWCRSLAQRIHASRLHGLVPAGHVPVQCTLFEKSTDRNWLVPIHQDLGIPVRKPAQQRDLPGFSGWSVKEGESFVQAPAALLEDLVAVRLHLDACGPQDGPLHVVPGSHLLGVLAPAAARDVRATRGTTACIADAGDALVMRPLLLHASSKASGTSLRRVLHVLFGPLQLPHGLRWAAVPGAVTS